MRLSDCFIEIIAYTAFVVRSDSSVKPTYEQVRTSMQRLISHSESCREKAQISREDYNLARFAVFAWVDEAILASDWQGRQQWQREQLQRQYYQITEAGELFFDKLNTIGPHQRDVREVYYLCLALGFSGQYCQAGDEFLLEQLRTSNLKLLMGSSIGVPALDKEELFPEAYPAAAAQPQQLSRRRRWSTFTLLCAVVPLGLYGLLFIIYHFILANISQTLISTVP